MHFRNFADKVYTPNSIYQLLRQTVVKVLSQFHAISKSWPEMERTEEGTTLTYIVGLDKE
jgi:hypothetical protein